MIFKCWNATNHYNYNRIEGAFLHVYAQNVQHLLFTLLSSTYLAWTSWTDRCNSREACWEPPQTLHSECKVLPVTIRSNFQRDLDVPKIILWTQHSIKTCTFGYLNNNWQNIFVINRLYIKPCIPVKVLVDWVLQHIYKAAAKERVIL